MLNDGLARPAGEAVMAETNHTMAMGWLPDFPDFRDYTVEQDEVKEPLKKAGVTKPLKTAPKSVDLRPWCSPIEDQASLGSCTAHAGVGLVEYFERRAFGKHTDASRLFLYKVTRNLMRMKGDTGAFLRTTMGAMTLFGVPPEEYYDYVIGDFDKEPPAFCYAFAQNYKAISYYRLDPPETKADFLLAQIKTHLSAGLPSMFGFTVFNSIEQASTTGKIPFPLKADRVAGGHAVDAVGYDDGIKIKNTGPGGAQTTGALLIRNSWGAGWGDAGYGWLPYEYVLRGLATDWWCLVKSEWIETGQFKA
jgi:C1A family cysteine protease